MKVMTILGTRPEIIRLSLVIKLLDEFAEEHILVHTGQNFDDRLSKIFFEQLQVREPDYHMNVRGAGFSDQIGQILTQSEACFRKFKPDRLLILGDTNSGLSAIVARRMGIPVYHMEAGNRCFDDRVPEEVNRRVIDHSSSILMPYTHNSKENLMREGIAQDRLYVTGNPIFEVLEAFTPQINASEAMKTYGVEKGKFFLVTLHRSENVDHEGRLKNFLEGLKRLHKAYGFPIIGSLHPRTRDKIAAFGIDPKAYGITFVEPLSFFDFVNLEKNAFCLLSDSGTVQEEGCIFGVPNVTIRDVTERPETVECGSNILTGAEPEGIERAVKMVTRVAGGWNPPVEYLAPKVSETVGRIVLSYRLPDHAELLYRQSKN
ncbi:MAG: UDP-N-acetylglucosamine 2-epimerase (non-hydrolyzing) [Armatimonadetes bacterium]|nr:UDP-N-acetylglucosamine 2-epimerase (non-hydrolyzing) [Armatimonadota bacterium]